MTINQSSFVLFRLPHQKDVALWHLDKNKNTTDEFIFHSFDNLERIALQAIEKFNFSVSDLSHLKFDIALEPYTGTPAAMSKDKYLEKAACFIDKLNTSSYEKIILSRAKIVDKIDDLGFWFQALCERYPTAWVYLFHHNHETWLGASPEKLLVSTAENFEFETVALAGTKSLAENRDWTTKEYKEHDIVVQYITSKFNIDDIRVHGPYTIDLGEIQHLKTDIHIINPQLRAEDILRQLHPTPAVCGIPKEEAKRFILENEGYDRRFYTGYFGIKTSDQSMFYVNLRCGQLFQNKTALYVGGGLIAESQALSEWNETELKSRALL